jgi:hypothetical protein
MNTTPIAYIVFNRPQHTEKSFDVLRKYKPNKLFIIADGPRDNHPTDVTRCDLVRKIVNKVDWNCEVSYNFSDINLGLKKRVSSGIDWVFESVDRAIILEDDCIPNEDFFRFCGNLLEYYKNNPQICVITGNNFQRGISRNTYSYYFSKFNHCWGWATWKQAWKHYDGSLSFWPAWSKSKDWYEKFLDNTERKYWTKIFDRVYQGKIDSWAYPWTACNWHRNALSVAPNVNLVSNIGFGIYGTHATSANHSAANLQTHLIGEISHPSSVRQDLEADSFDFNNHFEGKKIKFPRLLLYYPFNLFNRFLSKLKHMLSP